MRLAAVLAFVVAVPALADQATFDVKPSPAIGTAPLTVDFTVCDINDNSAQDKKAAVDFGDGQSSVQSCRATHTYQIPGTYQVTLRFKEEAIALTVQVLPNPKPIVELSASPNPISGLDSSTITMRLTDPDGGPLTWSASLQIPPPYSGGSLFPSSGGPLPSGGTATTTYQTPGGLAVGTVTVTATSSSGLTGSQSIVIPTCQPSGTVSYPGDSGGPYPVIPAGDSITFTVFILDCAGVSVTVSATASNAGGGRLTMSPNDGVVLGEGTVAVTFQSREPTTATITITGTDSLGFTNPFLRDQMVIVQ